MSTYLESIFKASEGCLIDGWGWFVDIEKGANPVPQMLKRQTRQMTRPFRVPTTIIESPTAKLRSHKSMDSLLQFELEMEQDEDEDDRKFYNKCIGYFGVASVLILVLFF